MIIASVEMKTVRTKVMTFCADGGIRPTCYLSSRVDYFGFFVGIDRCIETCILVGFESRRQRKEKQVQKASS